MSQVKSCAKCKIEKPLSEYSVLNKVMYSGKIKRIVYCYCKECSRKINLKNYKRRQLKKQLNKDTKE